MDSELNVLWSAVNGPIDNGPSSGLNIASAVAIDESDSIIMSGNVGTVKYAPDGNVQWEAPEYGDTLRLDRFGNIFLSKQAARDDGLYECEIIKLDGKKGTLRWQTRFHDNSLSDNWPAGLMTDHDGNVYFASLNGERTTIVKLVEHGRGNQK